MSQSESCANVGEWLGVLRLEQYSDAFQSAGYATLQQCRSLTPEQLECIGITLPGHQRRILANGETLRPTPRKRETPVPRERQVSRMQESSGEGEKPVPGKRQMVPRNDGEKERDGGIDRERKKPVPKERTKFRSTTPDNLDPSPPPALDTSLPPVPPRSTPNCPPQPFTLPPVQTSGSPKLERREVRAPALQCRSVSPSSTFTPPQPPSHPPDLPSTANRPQTLAIQPNAQYLTVDGGRKSSPVSPIHSPCSRSIPPLPPKAGIASKGPPPIPQRFPDVYSKGIISTAFITNVTTVGELKFEVVTNNRTFIFRAESEAERNEWVTVLQDCTSGRQRHTVMNPGSPLAPDYQGYLELKGLRSKLYTVVASDKVFLYKNIDDYRIGLGITSIEMNVGNIKVSDRRSFDLTTPYRIFSFIAESEQMREQWVNAMRDAIGEALSNSEVAERIWAESSNSLCADCEAPKPEWAAINLCVVVCKQCAGEHRGLGPSISKVRSLKMDKKVWTEELIQLFLVIGNERANSFWAANVPPSEALSPSSCSEERRRFISNKYRQGKYRRYHALYGNQRELNHALCINVQCSDVLETLSLIFCGADVNCSTGLESQPSPLSLATAHSQPLQAELLNHNLNTEEVDAMDPEPYPLPPSVSHNGFLFKTASMARPVTERKAKEEFSRRWCTLNDGVFSYYESDKNSNPNGALKASEIVCLASDNDDRHGYNNTFEIYTESERLYLFGTDDSEVKSQWVKSIAKAFIPVSAEPLLRLNSERIGKLMCKDGLNLQRSKVGWFALEGSVLHVYLEGSQVEEIHLRKLNELCQSLQCNITIKFEELLFSFVSGERAVSSGLSLCLCNILLCVFLCVLVNVPSLGMVSEGIYRKSGVNSRVAALCERFRHDARSLCLREGEHQVDDVSNTLKRFFRELKEGVFTTQDSPSWLSTASKTIQDESTKISQYKQFLNKLPHVNKATLQALIEHLYCVQHFSDDNQMNNHNLAIVFGPTLFQTDGKDYAAGRAIEDLIEHYKLIFEVDEQQLNKQIEVIEVIHKMRNLKNPPSERGGDFICTVYLEEKASGERHVKIPGSMTALELTLEILDQRNIPIKDKDYWSCWEICCKEEMERPLHYQERVLPIVHSIGTESHLLIKKHAAMEAITLYLSSKPDASKHGMIKFREERSILGLGLTSFHERYFILNYNSLRMYKDVRSNRPEREWPVKNLKVYLGIKKKLRPPTCPQFDFYRTVCFTYLPLFICRYLCCETQSEMREWYATFLSIQYDGNVWPQDGLQHKRVSRELPDTRHGNVSLIPLRGSENEMRNSVAAFSQDQLAVNLLSSINIVFMQPS
uniref:ArfGAP with RhoGAP domain, ankyrin repeat and PH domain 1 n=1 Tax=Astatotilapia calliptera TaxID=8154 RepID=A0AAX7TTH2_ASTCA